ncbi:MAG TPA: deoxynucleotide monophosphate kinase [Burkholderiaceae bacterium]|nr:deoxynucleotide monophosphate kinase [Burkholderiaceae bacterium]
MQLIGIHGKARSGKDTVAKWFGRERGAFLSAFAFPIKQAVIGMFAPLTGIGWEHFENTELKETGLPHIGVSPRALAQALGTEFGRECVHPDVWVMMTESYLKSCQVWGKPNQVVVMSDLRFENEAEWLRRNGGTVIHLTRPGADGKVGLQGHASESGIIIETGDIGIHNGGTVEELHAKLAELFPQRAAA